MLCKQFLDYMASQDKAGLTYKARYMVLAIHSNASYLSESKARTHAGEHMFMAGRDGTPKNNGAVLNILQIIRAVMSSAAEAELSALFINAKTAVSMGHTLKELGHPQPPTPMQTDNKTTHDLLTNKIAKGIKGNGHAFLLATMLQSSGTIQILLETGHTELGRLIHQAFPGKPPQGQQTHFPDTARGPQYTKLFPLQQDKKPNVKSTTKPLTTTNSFTKSFGKNLLQIPRFKIKTINTVTAKSA
jgi:hypothetical protein